MTHWIYDAFKFKRYPRLPQKELSHLRFNLLKEQLQKAYQNVSYYQTAFKQRGLDPHRFKTLLELRDYPIIDRDVIQQNESLFLSANFPFEKMPRSHSSGSTGKPLWTYFDKNTWVRKKYLLKLRTRMECGLKLGDNVAIFDTVPPAELEARNLIKMFSNPALRVKFFSIFEETEKNLNGLIQWEAHDIDSPPNHLFRIAREMERKKLETPSVKRIFTSSEYLEPSMRKFIEKVFGAEVFDIYGCTEIKEIAWECEKHEGYHINEDDVIVEILHDETPAQPGEIGDIVLTDLRNKAMPLIRYRIGDRGLLVAGDCSCGRSFSRMVPAAGRASEYITTPGGSKISPYRFTTAIEKTRGLLQYQVIQETLDSITVKVIMNGRNNDKEIIGIQDNIQKILGDDISIHVEICDKITLEKNGKYKVVKSKIE
jgi:phenylacetate-CoA ligase